MRVVIGARKSELARIQAYQVGTRLREALPSVDVNYYFRESLGDQMPSAALWEMPEKGVFTEDLATELLEGRCDLVVHSFKDLPLEPRRRTWIVATLPRADARDVLLFRADRESHVRSRGGIRILSSSPRRAFNLTTFLKDALPFELHSISFEPVRGNVPTRVRKLFSGDGDGLVVAKAAVDRILEAQEEEIQPTKRALREHLKRCWWMVLPLEENPTAPGQGALAIEIARERTDLAAILGAINDGATYAGVEEERRLLGSYGGGCHQKIGVSVLHRPYGKIVRIKGETDRGETLDRVELFSKEPPLPPTTLEKIWPLEPRSDDWFDREPLPAVPPPPAEYGLWVAKGDALPSAWSFSPEQILWTSGLTTWKKLARRGFWVHGSSESLGECEDPAIDSLAERTPHWLKLTHENGYREGRFDALATYRLVRRKSVRRLEGKTHYYWTSGSSFLAALSGTPEIRSGWHSCGPGHTYEVIRNALGPGAKLRIALNHASWLLEVRRTS